MLKVVPEWPTLRESKEIKYMYRVKRKRITRVRDGDRIIFEPGDEIEPTEAELRSFSDNLQKVETVTESDSSDAEEESTEETEDSQSDESEPSEETPEGVDLSDLPNLSEMNLPEIEDALKGRSFSNEEIEVLHDLESDGKDRVGAHSRIDEYGPDDS